MSGADVLTTETAIAPPVIVRLPANLGAFEICVRHEPWGVRVDGRRDSRESWEPIEKRGGTVEVRP